MFSPTLKPWKNSGIWFFLFRVWCSSIAGRADQRKHLYPWVSLQSATVYWPGSLNRHYAVSDKAGNCRFARVTSNVKPLWLLRLSDTHLVVVLARATISLAYCKNIIINAILRDIHSYVSCSCIESPHPYIHGS